MSQFKPRLLSSVIADSMTALAKVEQTEVFEGDTLETESWMAFYTAMMPITDWLIRGITPLLRVEFVNSIIKGACTPYPSLNLQPHAMEAMYKRGAGRAANTVAGTQFPPFHIPAGDYQTLDQKGSASRATYARKVKNGDYFSTASVGNPLFLAQLHRDITTNTTMGNYFEPINSWDLEGPIVAIRDPKDRKAFMNKFGEEFFDIQSPYQKNFKLTQKFSDYLKQATGVEPADFIAALLNELDLSYWVLEHSLSAEDVVDVPHFIEAYLNWLDMNATSFDIIAPPQVASGFPLLRDSQDSSKRIDVVSLTDPQLPNASLPGAVALATNNFAAPYSSFDFFVDAVISNRDTTMHMMLELPKDVAKWATQSQGEVDDYYLIQILSRAQYELANYETYQTSALPNTVLGDHTTGFYSHPPVEDTIAKLKGRKVLSIGVDENGFGVDAIGQFIYMPTKLDNINANRKDMQEYMDQIQVNKSSRLLAIRDPFDIMGQLRVIGKPVSERPRPESKLDVKPLYVDWGLGAVIGVNSEGCISDLYDLKHVTPLRPNHLKNYANAALYPVVLRDSSSWTKSMSDILNQTKPNQFRAVTEPLKTIFNSFATKVATPDDVKAWTLSYLRDIFQTRTIEGLELPLFNEDELTNFANTIHRGIASAEPMTTFATYGHTPYYYAYRQLINIFGNEESIPAEYDDIVNIAQNGWGDYFKVKDLGKKWESSPSLLTRLFGRILMQTWAAVEGRIDMFYKVTSFELSHRYYGTLGVIVDLMKNPRPLEPKIRNTTVQPPADFKPAPLAGAREGYSMLPHQLRVDHHTTTMMLEDVEVEILDAQAGAGKTHSLLIDVMRRLDEKKIKRPLIICPGYLIKNYIEDAAYIFKGRMNVIALDTVIKNYDPVFGVKTGALGLEGMLTMIETAPPNTLFVTSFSFLSSGNQSAFELPVGTSTVKVNPHLEMMLEANFDYVGADEFHELRNAGTAKGEVAKALFYRAKYRKGATGTFLNTSPSDIPAQTGMLDPTIFGSPSDFFEYYADNEGGKSNRISKLREGRKDDLVNSLRTSTGYIQVKRKEWAALLPERKDTYHVLELDEESAQWKIYQAILQQVLTEIAKILEKNKELAKDSEKGDEEASENLDALLRPYLQRLEMLLITPALDKDYEQLVQALDLDYDENYVSPAIERCIHIVETHLYGLQLPKDPAERQQAIQENANFMDVDSITNIDEITHIPAAEGKILIFCNYNTSVQAVYNALPQHLKEQAILYDAKNKDRHIFEFKNNPNKKILIGIQTSLSTGHNFQFCTRLIRLEQVWSPGEVEQGESRINRPDPKNKGAKRSKIFYDWVVIDGTIQVTKIARLISRMIVNTEIEEFGNPAYKDVPYLPILVMNLKTIQDNCWFESPADKQAGVTTTRSLLKYLTTKRDIDSIQKREFAEWTKNYTGPTDAVEVDIKDPIEGSAIVVNVPPIPGQTIANAEDFNVVNVAKYETMVGTQDVDLVGMRCLTPEGDGIVAGMSGSKLRVVINETKYSFDRLAVNLYLTDGITREDLFAASGLTTQVMIDGKSVKGSKTSKSKKAKQTMTDDQIVEELGLHAEIKKQKKAQKEMVSLDEMYSQSVDFLKSKAKDNMPKVIKTKKKPVPEPTDSETGVPDKEIEAYASNTNGALCLMLSSEDADLLERKNVRMLTNMGFHLDPDCWYAEIPNRKVMQDMLDKFEAKFDIPEKTLDQLYELLDAFSSGRKKMLNADHSSLAEIKEYWLQDNRRALRKDPNALVPMPVVQDGILYIMLDMEHPASKRAKRLRVPNLTWESSGGLWMKLYSSKKSCAVDLRELQKYFTLHDKQGLKDSMAEIVIRNKSYK